MALIDDYGVSQNGDYIYRVQMALVSTAISIQAEATSTANHSARSGYALLLLADPLGYAKRMAYAFSVDGSTDLNSTDAQLKTRASAVFNAFCVQG